jgi:hypothetical protein
MTVSFYINKNDIQELSYLEENFMVISLEEIRNNAVVIECFISTDEIKRRLDIRHERSVPNTNFIQVNIDYLKFDKIKEYLRF